MVVQIYSCILRSHHFKFQSLHENLELENVQPTSDLEVLAKHFVNILKERSEADGSLKVHKDAAFTENPMEREDIEETVKVKTLKTI